MKRTFYALGALTALALATPAYAVTTVTYNGQALPSSVSFAGQTDTASTGTLQLGAATIQTSTLNPLDTVFIFHYILTNTSSDATNIGGFGFDITGGTLDLATSSVTTTSGGTVKTAIDAVNHGQIS